MVVDRADATPARPGPLELMRDEMRSGERLVWAESPAPARLAVQALPLSFFGIFFAGFALFWIIGAWGAVGGTDGVFMFFPLFGLPFLIVGLGILLAPLWAYMGAARTIYAITSDRLIIRKGKSVKSFEPDEIDTIERRDHANGLGDVIFAREVYRTRGRHGSRTRTRKIGFFGVPDARRVEDAVRTLKDSADA